MVIGNGLVARAFGSYNDNSNTVIFASGVSNSSSKNTADFLREQHLLSSQLTTHTDKLFVYFSTCSLYDQDLKDSQYIKHKKQMEQYIMDNHSDYLIFRISNLAGRTDNPHTILNYLYQHIKSGDPFILWDNAERNIIDIDNAFNLCDTIIQRRNPVQKIYDIANIRNYRVRHIVEELEKAIHKKSNYTISLQKSIPKIPMTGMDSYKSILANIFTPDYLEKVIQKYYSC